MNEGKNEYLKFSREFYRSREWFYLKKFIKEIFSNKCMNCGGLKELNIDHVKSKYEYPELIIEPTNLQILCKPCNFSKGKNSIDYRSDEDLKAITNRINFITRACGITSKNVSNIKFIKTYIQYLKFNHINQSKESAAEEINRNDKKSTIKDILKRNNVNYSKKHKGIVMISSSKPKSKDRYEKVKNDPSIPANAKMKFGKYKGQNMRMVRRKDFDYYQWYITKEKSII